MALVTIWRVDGGDLTAPEETQAEEPATWPGVDVKGRQLYGNVCFRDREEAWAYLRRDVGYQIANAARALRENEKQRAEILEEAAKACVRHACIAAGADADGKGGG